MEREMSYFLSPGRLALFGLAALLCIAGCHKNAAQIASDTNQAGTACGTGGAA
jgi:hypothetical protein